MKRMILSLMAMAGVLTLSAQEIYDFKVMNDEGQEVSLSDYKGKVLRFTRNTKARVWRFSTSPATSLENRRLERFRRFTSSARQTSTSSSRSSTRLR